jgi:acyl-CoA synthetase (AMP-forming)/AMP-acid ligase II
LAILLPNEPEYIELVYACAWLGVIAVPLNTRLSAVEIDHVLSDANPRGVIRNSSLPTPKVELSWQLVLDKEPLDVHSDSYPDAIYDPEAVLALIYTSGTISRRSRRRKLCRVIFPVIFAIASIAIFVPVRS